MAYHTPDDPAARRCAFLFAAVAVAIGMLVYQLICEAGRVPGPLPVHLLPGRVMLLALAPGAALLGSLLGMRLRRARLSLGQRVRRGALLGALLGPVNAALTTISLGVVGVFTPAGGGILDYLFTSIPLGVLGAPFVMLATLHVSIPCGLVVGAALGVLAHEWRVEEPVPTSLPDLSTRINQSHGA
ncbi:MAG: hypothetical protein HY320_07005 [Armatimonadetes bacterium]|nr:hypothetical protein [Armatimonadota bacterium]